jgi:hypothetical protein
MVLVVRVVQHAIEDDVVDLGDCRQIAGNRAISSCDFGLAFTTAISPLPQSTISWPPAAITWP